MLNVKVKDATAPLATDPIDRRMCFRIPVLESPDSDPTA
jgi:hypothetical protein